MKPFTWIALISFSTSAIALPAKFLDPDSTGRPQIQITDAGQYYVFRAADAYDGGCDSRWYVSVTDSNNKTWCRTTAAYPQNAIVTDTVPLDAVAENSPAEFEYMVGTSTNVNSATYIGWAPQIAVNNADPVASWLQKINTQYGSNITRAAIPDTASSAGNMSALSVTYNSAVHNWTVYYNNKYIVLFNENGALMGLTHRAYGMEFINPYNRAAENSYPYIINTPATSLGSSTAFTKTIDNGKLVFYWSSLWSTGFSIKITWNLKSNSDEASSSGLNGKIEIVTSGTQINSALFPFIYGLSYGAGKEITVPRQNGGKKYFPSTTYSPSTTLTVYGEYPSANWQSQFYTIRDGEYSFYMATEDAAQLPKNFHAYSVMLENQNEVAGSTDFMHFPLDGAANVVTTYPVVMTPMVGGWERVAKKYQYWAKLQKWNADGSTVLPPVASRPVSSQLKQGAFWWTSFYGGGNDGRLRPSMFVDHSNSQKTLIGPNASGGNVRAAFHLYNWWDNKFDTNYPLYVPNQDLTSPSVTWQQSISTVQSDGSLVAPYNNAAVTDVTNASTSDIPTYDNVNARNSTYCPQDTSGNGWWGKTFPLGTGVNLADAMLKGTNSLPYVACFDSYTRLLALMDPSSSIWQSAVDSNISTIFDFGSGGVYLDSFAAASAQRDSYASSLVSGHATGFGSWYRNGVRQIGANAIQKAVSKEQSSPVFTSEPGVRRFIASEYFSEATIAHVDLVMNYEDAKPTDIPVIQNIYNQYQMMVGQRPLVDSDPVRKAIFGRSLVWGYQLGPVETYGICPSSNCSSASSQDVLTYVRTLEKARENVQQSNIGLDWNAARLIGQADDTANIINYSAANDWCSILNSSQACPASLPAVRGALWSSDGGNAANYLVLTNTTSTAVTSSIPVPKAWSSASLVYQSTSGPGSLVTPFNNAVSVYMPGNSVVVYKATLSSVKANQYISVTTAPPTSAANGSAFTVAATSSSGLSVSVTTAGGCSNSGNTVTMTSAVTACTVNFNQSGDSNYSAAQPVSYTVQATAAHGLTGTYYNTNNFSGTPALVQIDPTVNFSWSGSPAAGVNADGFSVRWTGKVVPPVSGTYKFCATADDGAKVWVNGVNVVTGAWWNTGCGTIALTQNVPVSIQVDFVDSWLTATAILKWAYPTGNEMQSVVPNSQLYAQ